MNISDMTDAQLDELLVKVMAERMFRNNVHAYATRDHSEAFHTFNTSADCVVNVLSPIIERTVDALKSAQCSHTKRSVEILHDLWDSVGTH